MSDEIQIQILRELKKLNSKIDLYFSEGFQYMGSKDDLLQAFEYTQKEQGLIGCCPKCEHPDYKCHPDCKAQIRREAKQKFNK